MDCKCNILKEEEKVKKQNKTATSKIAYTTHREEIKCNPLNIASIVFVKLHIFLI